MKKVLSICLVFLGVIFAGSINFASANPCQSQSGSYGSCVAGSQYDYKNWSGNCTYGTCDSSQNGSNCNAAGTGGLCVNTYTSPCSSKTYYCPNTSCSGASFSTAANAINTCSFTYYCTYVSRVNTWSSCSNSLSYAVDVTYSTTTNNTLCVDVPTVRSCTACYSPDDEIKPLGLTLDPTDSALDTYLKLNNNLTNDGKGFNGVKSTYVKGGPGLAVYAAGVNIPNSESFDKSIYPNSYNYIVSGGGVNDFGRNVPDYGSVSIWIKTNSLNSGDNKSPRIFGPNNENECFLQWGGNKIQCDLGTGGTMVSSEALEANKWYHLVVTWNSPAHKQQMWLNGELVATGSSTIKPKAGTNMWIGRSHSVNSSGSLNGQPFNGSIDDVALFRRVLSDCEIKKLFKGINACLDDCTDDEAATSTLSASCYASPTITSVGQTVTWTATTTGSTGPFTYAWSGTGLTGKNTRVATTSYSVDGTYNASITVGDGVGTTTVACAGQAGSSCTGTCCDGHCTCVGSSCSTTNGLCGYANGEEYETAPVAGLCSPGTVNGFTGSGPWTWNCLGSNNATTTDDSIGCSASKLTVLPGLDCSIRMIDPSPKVNVNTFTSWEATSTTLNLAGMKTRWSIMDSNGNITTVDSNNNILSKVFTTIGHKTLSVEVSTSTPGVYQSCVANPDTATTTVVLTGGTTRER